MAKINKGKEVLEDPNALLDKIKDSEEFFERNKKAILYVVGGLLVAVLAFVGYRYNQNQNNQAAQEEMFNAVFAWERDSLKTALEGNKSDKGLLEIADEYSGTDAGNLAKYYAGVAFLKEGKFDEAIEKLENFKSNDLLLQGLVYSLTGDAYLEKKEFDQAINKYSKAASYKPNEAFTPRYLMKLALANELSKDYGAAVEAYDRIIQEFPLAPQVQDARKFKARAEGLLAAK